MLRIFWVDLYLNFYDIELIFLHLPSERSNLFVPGKSDWTRATTNRNAKPLYLTITLQ